MDKPPPLPPSSPTAAAPPAGSEPKPVPCGGCGWLARCGGPAQFPGAGPPGLWGCFEPCAFGCRDQGCDWTCPHNPALWLPRWREVGGLFNTAAGPLRGVAAARLPAYLPMIRHGKRRRSPANAEAVALSLYEVIRRRRDGRYGRALRGAAALRREFKLRRDCRVLLVSVGPDESLERFWQQHRASGILEVLAGLDLIGVTAPNFSFFDDAPRTHSLWNRQRMLRVAERLSAAGVAVIPHLNASNEADWSYWAGFLREHADVACVAKEFQTGLAKWERGQRAFDDLARLQQRLGRPLHPVLVGGARYLPQLDRHFAGGGTLVDSRPFMNTVYRRWADASRADGRLRWRRCRTVAGAKLDALLDYNLAHYQAGARRLRRPPAANI